MRVRDANYSQAETYLSSLFSLSLSSGITGSVLLAVLVFLCRWLPGVLRGQKKGGRHFAVCLKTHSLDSQGPARKHYGGPQRFREVLNDRKAGCSLSLLNRSELKLKGSSSPLLLYSRTDTQKQRTSGLPANKTVRGRAAHLTENWF